MEFLDFYGDLMEEERAPPFELSHLCDLNDIIRRVTVRDGDSLLEPLLPVLYQWETLHGILDHLPGGDEFDSLCREDGERWPLTLLVLPSYTSALSDHGGRVLPRIPPGEIDKFIDKVFPAGERPISVFHNRFKELLVCFLFLLCCFFHFSNVSWPPSPGCLQGS